MEYSNKVLKSREVVPQVIKQEHLAPIVAKRTIKLEKASSSPIVKEGAEWRFLYCDA